MKTGLIVRMIVAAALVGLVGCDDPGPEVGDHTWNVSYSIANTSSQTIVVELAGPVMQLVGSGDVEIAAGETDEILRYSAFLAPPPDPARDWWCVEVRRAQDGALVQQLCPVSSDLWTISDPARFTADFTLLISDGGLQSPIADHCPRLEGVVVCASSGEPVQGAVVAFLHYEVDGRYTDEQGRYQLWLPSAPPECRIVVSVAGYASQEFAFPAGVTNLGDNRFRLDVELEPNR